MIDDESVTARPTLQIDNDGATTDSWLRSDIEAFSAARRGVDTSETPVHAGTYDAPTLLPAQRTSPSGQRSAFTTIGAIIAVAFIALMVVIAVRPAPSVAHTAPPEPALTSNVPYGPSRSTLSASLVGTNSGGGTLGVRTACNVRAEPSPSAKRVGGLSSGAQVTVLSRSESWSRVRSDDGTVGWIHDVCTK